MQQRITLEIAVDCEADAIAAALAGADRLELCADLAGHGFTPDLPFVHTAAGIPGMRTVAMVRPHIVGPGAADTAGFIYGREQWSLVMHEAEGALAAGAGGVVIGCLRDDGSLHAEQVRELVALAGDRETVFHRAIDLTQDPIQTAGQLADLGVTRILTSGMSRARTADELGVAADCIPISDHPDWQAGGDGWPRRLERIAAMVGAVGERIEVLPGAGIRAENAAEVVVQTGCGQVHSSGRVGGHFDAGSVRRLRAAIDAAR